MSRITSQASGKVDLFQHLDAVVAADADTRGGPLSDTVHGED